MSEWTHHGPSRRLTCLCSTAKNFGNANQESMNLYMQQVLGQNGPHFLPHIWSSVSKKIQEDFICHYM
uniref:Uncharacterized protein n=1 Tax=Amphilophus citrinellus TaxID=61819 RepID=A0A3Q0S7Y7_AMPCI